MPLNSNYSQRGFSLLEIMVALAVLSVIAVVSIPNYRKFSETQAIKNSHGDMIKYLRLAQSSASTQTNCSSNKPAQNWSFVINTSTKAYSIVTSCFNPATDTTPTLETKDPFTLPSYINITTTPGCSGDFKVTFTRTGASFFCQNNPISFNEITLNLRDTNTSVQKYIKINTTGTISESNP